MGQHVDSGCELFAGAKRRRTEEPEDSPYRAVPHPSLRGCFLVADFVSEEEEAALLRFVDGADAPPWRVSNWNGAHRGKIWGVKTDFAKRTFSEPDHAMPDAFREIIRRMRRVRELREFFPNEANAIDYRRREGHSLAAHCDDRALSGAVLVNLCLAGSAVMTYERDQGAGEESYRADLPRRALQIQSGFVRFNYKHGIANADFLDDRRVSITFRSNKHPGHHV